MGQPALTKLDDALSGVSVLGFDTSPFIYFIEQHPTHLPVLRQVFRCCPRPTVSPSPAISHIPFPHPLFQNAAGVTRQRGTTSIKIDRLGTFVLYSSNGWLYLYGPD